MTPQPKTTRPATVHAPAPRSSATRVRRVKSPQTILLVDDDDTMRLLVARTVKALKPRPVLQYVSDAFQGQDYLVGRNAFADRVTYSYPDLLILDLKMPLIDGFQFLEWVRSQPAMKELPILVLTGSSHPDHLKRALHLGADMVLLKPSHIEEILPKLKTLLGMH